MKKFNFKDFIKKMMLDRHIRVGVKVSTCVLCFIIVYYLFIGLFSLFSAKIEDNKFISSILQTEKKSVFNIKELNIKELEGKIILLNIYDIRDFSYIFSIDFGNRLDKKYKNNIVIIDIISNNIPIDENTVINYIIKNNIERPVIHVEDIYKDNGLSPNGKYFVLIDKDATINNIFDFDKVNEEEIEKSIDKLLAKSNNDSHTKKINIELEKRKKAETFIKSLTDFEYIQRIDDTTNGPYFIISDAKGRKIYIMTLNGEIISQIGNDNRGNKDGIAINATFCYPFGLDIEDNKYLYIADMCNNSIREVDLRTLQVSTLPLNNDLLKKPTDVKLFNENLIISTADNSLLKYIIKDKKLEKIKCDVCDTHITQLVRFNSKIYFINTKKNKLYSLDKNDHIEEVLNFDTINKNNISFNIDNNFLIDETGMYIVDKFNNIIVQIKENKAHKYSSNAKKVLYKFPTNMINVRDKIYITNEDKKEIVQVDRNTKNDKIIKMSFGYEYNKIKNNQEDYLYVDNIETTYLKSGKDNKIKINLNEPYSFEKRAPHFLSLLQEDEKNNSAILIKEYKKDDIIQNKTLKLPKLENDNVYYLHGELYYCNDSKNSPCLVNKYDKRIVVDDSYDNNVINIDFLYNN